MRGGTRLISVEIKVDIACDQSAGREARRYKCWRAWLQEEEHACRSIARGKTTYAYPRLKPEKLQRIFSER
jgi:hypothetical protein